ncbi:MAG: glucose-1-phosphate adenylyltransferase subunit GlgD [Christensenellales bacterium]|jgi:glucose-1-phosphate adenylyltransferase
MLDNAFGVIYTGENSISLKDLTYSRAVAAVPVGGRYRAIDFLMSNLVNSGITNVGVITQRNYHSLMDHLGAGKEWDLNRKRDGLFILPPFVTRENTGFYRGTADALKGIMGYIRRSSQRYCIFMGSHTIYNTAYDDAIGAHIESGADITMFYDVKAEPESDDFFERIYMTMDDTGRVTDVEVNPFAPSTQNVSMDCYILEKNLLEYLVEECVSHSHYDFVRDIIMAKLKELRVFGYEHKGYVGRIDSLLGYYKLNMDLLENEVRNDIFSEKYPVYTKVKDEVPAMYGNNVRAQHSIVADGCIVEGNIENCVLFRNVHIAPGATLKNCIVMQACEVQENAALENVILDKAVLVKRERRLVGQPTFPIIIRKNSIV